MGGGDAWGVPGGLAGVGRDRTPLPPLAGRVPRVPGGAGGVRGVARGGTGVPDGDCGRASARDRGPSPDRHDPLAGPPRPGRHRGGPVRLPRGPAPETRSQGPANHVCPRQVVREFHVHRKAGARGPARPGAARGPYDRGPGALARRARRPGGGQADRARLPSPVRGGAGPGATGPDGVRVRGRGLAQLAGVPRARVLHHVAAPGGGSSSGWGCASGTS